MKKNSIFGIIVVAAILLWSCGKVTMKEMAMNNIAYDIAEEADFEEAYFKSEDEKPSPETYISSFAAVENPNDTARKMIRTADIKFKVKDVIKATYNIENIIVRQGGFVENTNLTSQTNRTNETRIKADSTLVTTYYSVVNTLILRVPNTQLDTTLKEIAKLVDFMDYRIINAKDVTLDLLSKRLEQSRLAKYDSRMKNAIDSKGRKLDNITDAENNLLYKQAQADEAKLANMRTADKIKFSTINLSLYQNQSIRYEVVAMEKEIETYSEPFGTRFVDALIFGWIIIKEIFLFLVHLWAIILIAVAGFFGVKYLRKRYKK